MLDRVHIFIYRFVGVLESLHSIGGRHNEQDELLFVSFYLEKVRDVCFSLQFLITLYLSIRLIDQVVR